MDMGKDLQNAYDDGYKQRDSEIVLCKDCEWWERFGNDLFGNCECGHGVTDIQFYCKDGERRSE